jgi:hypothetical protein
MGSAGLLEIADPVRRETADTFCELRRTRCSKSREQLLTKLTNCLTLYQPNLVALRSRTGAVTIDAREQVSSKEKYAGAL